MEASGAGGYLRVDSYYGVAISNAGLIAARSGGKAVIKGALANSGVVEAAGGTIAVEGAITNTGLIETAGGTIVVDGAVTGAGSAVIGGGTLTFAAAFDEAVAFTRPTGELVLSQSQAYRSSITGFSRSGGTSLDLEDIGFTSSTEASFQGTSSAGTLTVTDGTHTAKIKLVGDYTGTTFTAGSDGHGGVTIVDTKNGLAPPAPHAFIAAAAALAPLAAAPAQTAMEVRSFVPYSLAASRAHFA